MADTTSNATATRGLFIPPEGLLSKNSPTGEALGKNFFQSFLLAGERYIASGLNRPDTDEARFEAFFKAVEKAGKGNANLIAGYFKRQAGLSERQRTEILGDLVKVKIGDKLVLATTGVDISKSVAVKSELSNALVGVSETSLLDAKTLRPFWETQLRSAKFTIPIGGTIRPRDPKPAGAWTKLSLRCKKVQVVATQDDWSRGDDDEVSIGIITTDPWGNINYTHAKPFGDNTSIDDGQIVVVKPEKSIIATVPILGTADNTAGHFEPRTVSFLVQAIEMDDGGWNTILKEAATYIKDKVQKEIIGKQLTETIKKTGNPIADGFYDIIIEALKKFFGEIVDWLVNFFSGKDDIVGTAEWKVLLRSWKGTPWGTNQAGSSEWTTRFAGNGGVWNVTFDWLLQQ